MSELQSSAPRSSTADTAVANFIAHVTPVPDWVVVADGKHWRYDASGHLVPVETIKPQDTLQDEVVRKIIGFARDLSAQIARFKGHTFEDLGSFDELLAQEYNTTKGGRKGNRTYLSFDGLLKVQVAMADLIDFGPELQQAKTLIDSCLTEWTADGREEIRALVLRAFNVEQEGQINQADLFKLLRLEIKDARWINAMQAIRDAIRVIGAKQYFRFYERPHHEAGWTAITIDLAKA